MGPLQFMVIRFEGNRFNGQIMPRLKALTDDGIVRIIDLLFVTRDAMGVVSCMELSDLDSPGGFPPIGLRPSEWFAMDDIDRVGGFLEHESSAAMVLVEHLWAVPLQEAIADAHGDVLAQALMPGRLAADMDELIRL